MITSSNYKFLITGGAGFIGSALVRFLIQETQHQVLVYDSLTYAGNLASLKQVSSDPRYKFIKGDICDRELLSSVFMRNQPDIIVNLAAETHVDRSIDQPADFIRTNIYGVSTLLECARDYWNTCSNKRSFRFHHVSTDEVYGSLGRSGLFTEETAYAPSSPYSASKASSDHLVRAWHHTYGLPILLSNCSNNYGPYQFPEKLIPLIIISALDGKPLPIYGDGQNIRDWLYVEDHVRALYTVATQGKVGQTYNIGGDNELTNLEVVNYICDVLDEIAPQESNKYSELIKFVQDRPGHDLRYATNATKIRNKLGWSPQETFESGIRKTVVWYLDNPSWSQKIRKQGNNLRRIGILQDEK